MYQSLAREGLIVDLSWQSIITGSRRKILRLAIINSNYCIRHFSNKTEENTRYIDTAGIFRDTYTMYYMSIYTFKTLRLMGLVTGTVVPTYITTQLFKRYPTTTPHRFTPTKTRQYHLDYDWNKQQEWVLWIQSCVTTKVLVTSPMELIVFSKCK